MTPSKPVHCNMVWWKVVDDIFVWVLFDSGGNASEQVVLNIFCKDRVAANKLWNCWSYSPWNELRVSVMASVSGPWNAISSFCGSNIWELRGWIMLNLAGSTAHDSPGKPWHPEEHSLRRHRLPGIAMHLDFRYRGFTEIGVSQIIQFHGILHFYEPCIWGTPNLWKWWWINWWQVKHLNDLLLV